MSRPPETAITAAAPPPSATLVRGIGLWQATALNVTMIVGAGVFLTVPAMLGELPGPYALLGWLAAGVLIFFDGLIWSELGAALPGSGGSYLYLLECYGRDRWGRLMAFLFIWQFMISGPLELASGLAAIAQFAPSLSSPFESFNTAHTTTVILWADQDLKMAIGPSRLVGFGIGVLIIVLLWRNITTLGRLTVTFWVGVLGTIAWILIEGALRFDPATAFDFSHGAKHLPTDWGWKLGPAMILAMYAYLGYYHVCYIGDEVHEPGRTVPRSILASVLIVGTLFVGVHLAMLGVVPWFKISPTEEQNLPARFMETIHGPWAATLVTVLLIWCIFGSSFAGLLGYSRIPYGAAEGGHFFAVFREIHPEHRIPHLSLLLVGGLTLLWSFFDLQNIINALVVTRILQQFVAQIFGVMLLRRLRPELHRPYQIWLYPLPCVLASAGWLYMYVTALPFYKVLGAATIVSGVAAYFLWSWQTGGWPFAPDKLAGGKDLPLSSTEITEQP
jgi:amino acid transporter